MNEARSGKRYLNTTFFCPFLVTSKAGRNKASFQPCHRLQSKSNSHEGYILSYHVRLEYIKRKKFTRSCKFEEGGEEDLGFCVHVCVSIFALLKAQFRKSPNCSKSKMQDEERNMSSISYPSNIFVKKIFPNLFSSAFQDCHSQG